MSNSSGSGKQGESTVLGLLRYGGWENIEHQVLVGGHVLDFRAKHPIHGEALFEVKVWEKGGGKDTVKKALWDAVDLKLQGIDTPYILFLSHDLMGNYRDQILRAEKAGFVHEARVIGAQPLRDVVQTALVRSPPKAPESALPLREFDGGGV